jgi:peptidoglycan pentaglycine glycine transferase (the first glycine)
MEIIEKNSDFLQSEQWRKFQENAGRKAFFVEKEGFSASIIEHQLPIVGKYFYIPRGPVSAWQAGLADLIDLAKKENAGWIRIDPSSEEVLNLIKENISEKIIKAPHDMQPRENFVLGITKPAEQLLAEMKPKTRYNIGLAQKKGVKIYSCQKNDMECMRTEMDFFRLTKEMAQRQGIATHPEAYYKKMIETIGYDMLKLYAAEYEGKIIAVNLVLFFGETATYLHGASSNENRNVMAPFLLQWQAILDAKEKGCTRYDFGGVKTNPGDNSWKGITQFKLGFSPQTKPVVFAGSYDIIINPRKYAVYRGLQRAKAFAVGLKR